MSKFITSYYQTWIGKIAITVYENNNLGEIKFYDMLSINPCIYKFNISKIIESQNPNVIAVIAFKILRQIKDKHLDKNFNIYHISLNISKCLIDFYICNKDWIEENSKMKYKESS